MPNSPSISAPIAPESLLAAAQALFQRIPSGDRDADLLAEVKARSAFKAALAAANLDLLDPAYLLPLARFMADQPKGPKFSDWLFEAALSAVPTTDQVGFDRLVALLDEPDLAPLRWPYLIKIARVDTREDPYISERKAVQLETLARTLPLDHPARHQCVANIIIQEALSAGHERDVWSRWAPLYRPEQETPLDSAVGTWIFKKSSDREVSPDEVVKISTGISVVYALLQRFALPTESSLVNLINATLSATQLDRQKKWTSKPVALWEACGRQLILDVSDPPLNLMDTATGRDSVPAGFKAACREVLWEHWGASIQEQGTYSYEWRQMRAREVALSQMATPSARAARRPRS